MLGYKLGQLSLLSGDGFRLLAHTFLQVLAAVERQRLVVTNRLGYALLQGGDANHFELSSVLKKGGRVLSPALAVANRDLRKASYVSIQRRWNAR